MSVEGRELSRRMVIDVRQVSINARQITVNVYDVVQDCIDLRAVKETVAELLVAQDRVQNDLCRLGDRGGNTEGRIRSLAQDLDDRLARIIQRNLNSLGHIEAEFLPVQGRFVNGGALGTGAARAHAQIPGGAIPPVSRGPSQNN